VREHLSGSASPTERTMSWLRGQGYIVDKVEQRPAFGSGRRSTTTRDFCGFGDLIAFRPEERGALAVQATTHDHVPERVAKIQAELRAAIWLQAGNRIQVVGWRKRPHGRRTLFVPTVVNVLSPGSSITVESPHER
jgi:hypothetical protein